MLSSVFKSLSVLGLALVVSFSSVPVRAESLSQAVDSALQYHPSVKAALLGVDIAHEQRREDVANYYPELSVSATGGRVYQDNSTSRGLSVSRGAAYSGFGEGSLTLNQMIFDGFGTKSRVEASSARKESASMNVMDVRESLALRAVEAYLDVLSAREGLEMMEQYRQKITKYLGRIRTMVDEGVSDDAELQQAESVQANFQGLIADYRGKVRIAEGNYIEAMGHIPDADMKQPVPKFSLALPDSETAIAYAQGYHPALRLAEYDSSAAYSDIGAEKSILFPELDGELSYLKSDKDDVVGGEAIDARAVLRLNWRLSTGGAELARLQRKKYEYKESQSQREQTLREVERMIRMSYAQRDTDRNQLVILHKRTELIKRLFNTYKTQFEGARITQLQLMQAENQLFNTRLERLEGEYEALASEYRVLASIGRLQESLNLGSAISDEQN